MYKALSSWRIAFGFYFINYGGKFQGKHIMRKYMDIFCDSNCIVTNKKAPNSKELSAWFYWSHRAESTCWPTDYETRTLELHNSSLCGNLLKLKGYNFPDFCRFYMILPILHQKSHTSHTQFHIISLNYRLSFKWVTILYLFSRGYIKKSILLDTFSPTLSLI